MVVGSMYRPTSPTAMASAIGRSTVSPGPIELPKTTMMNSGMSSENIAPGSRVRSFSSTMASLVMIFLRQWIGRPWDTCQGPSNERPVNATNASSSVRLSIRRSLTST